MISSWILTCIPFLFFQQSLCILRLKWNQLWCLPIHLEPDSTGHHLFWRRNFHTLTKTISKVNLENGEFKSISVAEIISYNVSHKNLVSPETLSHLWSNQYSLHSFMILKHSPIFYIISIRSNLILYPILFYTVHITITISIITNYYCHGKKKVHPLSLQRFYISQQYKINPLDLNRFTNYLTTTSDTQHF